MGLRWIRVVALALTIVAVASPIIAPAAQAATTKDWSRAVTRLPNGAYLLGNPNARIKLIEYLSLTCDHCADFALNGLPKLRAKYMKGGAVSLEIRHALRDRLDFTASLLARCGGPQGYIATSEAMFAAQESWLKRGADYVRQNDAAISTKTMGDALVMLAEGSGLEAIALGRGLSTAKAETCLKDSVEHQRLAAMTGEAWKERQIPGTPSFVINGQLANGANWTTLEPQIVAALK